MPETLSELRTLVVAAMKKTGQGSYERRAPKKAALPVLGEAQRKLNAYLLEKPADLEALRLLALVEEALLHYGKVIRLLEKIIELGGKNPKDLKKLALCRQAAEDWSALGLSPDELRELGDYLDGCNMQMGGDDRMYHTREWLKQHKPERTEVVLKALSDRGAYTDLEVLWNVTY